MEESQNNPIQVSEAIKGFIDSDCGPETNLQHLKYIFEGYRAFMLSEAGVKVEMQPYPIDGPKSYSFNIGKKLAEKDALLISKAEPIIPDYRAIRENLGLTLRYVETETGISNAYLSQLERKLIAKPSHSVIMKLNSFYKLQK